MTDKIYPVTGLRSEAPALLPPPPSPQYGVTQGSGPPATATLTRARVVNWYPALLEVCELGLLMFNYFQFRMLGFHVSGLP